MIPETIAIFSMKCQCLFSNFSKRLHSFWFSLDAVRFFDGINKVWYIPLRLVSGYWSLFPKKERRCGVSKIYQSQNEDNKKEICILFSLALLNAKWCLLVIGKNRFVITKRDEKKTFNPPSKLFSLICIALSN